MFTLRQTLQLRHVYEKPTIVVFLDIRPASDSVDRSVLWPCLLRNRIPESLFPYYVLVHSDLVELGLMASFRLPLLSLLESDKDSLSPHFFFTFAIEVVLKTTLDNSLCASVELLPGR
ncbi:unnamed protein product [Dicrocoelium dendriticum]|nr:unnamed protein product [Dicrocoelium dendriticum]